ncbi:nicotinamide riboside kinase 1 isoform X2 [Octopus bimaculoides]|nr:nicotinamide riboside kinase 1 isoform X2 [Octopus bimaculoides]XP_014784598.1 nicotinamide riboside kinase 1 isoform X2 [Octopus bimaculoides]XP_052828109.1 nicotinamide riboside kinase 1 isoform X2 [Octopus bimaculoides]XP_052828110.1 nicotinamide riboside kinase 1 isoform X2 [Octopus bimaculoides]|eukprot:XP_014784596.1 PREDICTED: nicotinamide riboside kinase 1-like [Octopus bimaculoides]
MNRKNILSVGISGATNSGKSSLTKKLAEYFPNSTSFCQDDCFREVGSKNLELIPELNCYNWDVLSALDTDKMVTDINQQASSLAQTDKTVHLLLVDGFLIFNHRPLSEMFDRKYFLTVSKDVCMERRSIRVYDPPDCDGYFEKIAWPSYLKNLEAISDQKDIVYHNSDSNFLQIFETIKDDITNLLKTKERDLC